MHKICVFFFLNFGFGGCGWGLLPDTPPPQCWVCPWFVTKLEMQKTYRDIWCLFARKETKSGFTFQNDTDYSCILLHVYSQIIYIYISLLYMKMSFFPAISYSQFGSVPECFFDNFSCNFLWSVCFSPWMFLDNFWNRFSKMLFLYFIFPTVTILKGL